MKQCILFFIMAIVSRFCFAQNFNGQWKGSFEDNSAAISWGSNKCEYVLELEIVGNKISGFSYTYFSENGKKYYTICKLKGIADLKKKYVEVTETERTKTNIPVNVENSFQLHKLSWRREAGKEILEGNWLPAPGQEKKNTGFGTTLLAKRVLTEIATLAKKPTPISSPFSKPTKKANAFITAKTTKKPLQKKINATASVPTKQAAKPLAKNPLAAKIKPKPSNTEIKRDTQNIAAAKKSILTEKIVPTGFEKRNNAVLQTVNVENNTVNIEIYDNGDIDGDSISLFYNGKVLLAHKKLTSKPIHIEIPVNLDEPNELVMYADNLGTIPPNTALMIVMDGKKRYEVRITSDLKKSGTIVFLHKNKE
jgi:hypothetical protein